MRLRTLQHPSWIVDTLRSDPGRAGLPQDSTPVVQAEQLPAALRRLVRRLEDEGRAWIVFEHGWRSTVLAAELAFDRSRESGRPVLQVTKYNDEGRLLESLDWLLPDSGLTATHRSCVRLA